MPGFDDKRGGPRRRPGNSRDGAPGKRFPTRPKNSRSADSRKTGSSGKFDNSSKAAPNVASDSLGQQEKQGAAPPALDADVSADQLDKEAWRELRGLPKGLAERVAAHLVAAGKLVDAEPERALEHARYARRCASRVAIVREANGIVAYHAQQWSEALTELRASRRLSGGPGRLALIADCERGLGRPQRALDLLRDDMVGQLDDAEKVELRIVAAGARRDMGQADAAVVLLQGIELDPATDHPWNARLFYAYADNLVAAGRGEEAVDWFVHAADADSDGETNAVDRVAELTGNNESASSGESGDSLT